MTWGNQYATASLVSAYTVLQPVTASVLTAIILLSKSYNDCADVDDDAKCLTMPGVGDLGAIGVFLGLYLVISSEPAPPKNVPEHEPTVDNANPLLADDADPAPINA